MMTLAALTLLYFLPTLVASQRGHGVGGILILNFLFGWTGIGWLALLLWALVSRPPCNCAPIYHPYDDRLYYGWRRY